MEIKTERLVLRELKESDALDLVELYDDLEVSKQLNSVSHPFSLDDAKLSISYAISAAKEKKRVNYELGIEYENKIIGTTMLQAVNKTQGTCLIHYDLNRKYWRKGIASEAVRAMIDFAFKKLGIKKIESNPFADNIASCKLLEKLGFKKFVLIEKSLQSQATGIYHDVQGYVLSKD